MARVALHTFIVGHCGGGLTRLGSIRTIGDQIVTLWFARHDDEIKESQNADDWL
jgi:hypothetical protein